MKKKTYITPATDIIVISRLALLNGSLEVPYVRSQNTEEALSPTFYFD